VDDSPISKKTKTVTTSDMLRMEPKTKAERREAKHRQKMAVSGRNTKRLAQNLARRGKIDRKQGL